MLLALGIGIVLVGVLAALYSPFAGLLFYWAWFLVRPQEFILGLGAGIPIERCLALAMIAGIFVHRKALGTDRLSFTGLNKTLLVFLGINCLSVVTSVWKGNTLQTSEELGKIVVLYLCIVCLIENSAALSKFLWVYVLCIAWEAVSSIRLYFVDPYFAQGIQRATSLSATWGDPNATSTNLVLAIPILLLLFKAHHKAWKKVALLVLLASYLVCVVLTGSRMGGIMMVAVFFLLALKSERKKVLVPALAGCLLIGWLAIPREYQHRYSTLSTLVDDDASTHLSSSDESARESAEGRIAGFVVGWHIFLDHPVLGVGAGNFPYAFRFLGYTYHGVFGWHQPHNLPGQLLSELGLVGLVGFALYLIGAFRERRALSLAVEEIEEPQRLLLGLSDAVAVVIAGLILGGFSAHNLYRYNWYVAGALLVVGGHLARARAKERSNSEAAFGNQSSRDPGGELIEAEEPSEQMGRLAELYVAGRKGAPALGLARGSLDRGRGAV